MNTSLRLRNDYTFQFKILTLFHTAAFTNVHKNPSTLTSLTLQSPSPPFLLSALMGCCLSRSTTSSSRNPTSHPNNDTTRHRNPRPPPPPLEEETVKEVLTETPFADERIEAKAAGEKKNEKLQGVVEVKPQQPRLEAFEIQEVSEITVATENRSVSESVSAATVGGEKRGEEVMSKSRDRAEPVVSRHQKSVDQSPAKASRRRPYSGELTAGGPREKRVRSPAKRAIPSPEKKTHVAPRPVRGRSQSPATSNNRNTVNAGPSRIRRDAGERSGRRSRSPAGKAFQNSSSSNITGVGPGSEVNAGVNVGQHGDVCGTSRVEEEEGCPESLDNPLVSLECFIFL